MFNGTRFLSCLQVRVLAAASAAATAALSGHVAAGIQCILANARNLDTVLFRRTTIYMKQTLFTKVREITKHHRDHDHHHQSRA